MKGTVSAASTRVYLAAVGSVYKDRGLNALLDRSLVRAARRGLQGAQHRLVPERPRSPLPARHVLAILVYVDALVARGCATGDDLRTLRDCLATVTAFVFFNRASSNYSLLREGLLVDATGSTDDLIRLRPWVRKGLSHDHLDLVEFRIPVEANPRLAAAL
jgi:hypothetical protein